jgi:hypothetical protein
MENPVSTWIIGGLVIGLLAWLTVRMIKNRKKSACGCGCEGCPQAKKCNKENL